MKQGYTLVELLVAMTIVVMLAMMAVGIFNPTLQVNKANDARRKRDLNKIRTAFEEYYSDKGCYPSDTNTVDPNLVTQLMNVSNCNTGVFGSRMSSWPCDPVYKTPYYIYVERGSDGFTAICPHWFKVFANLQNKKDKDIPADFYTETTNIYYLADGTITKSQANYGVSSSNVLWYDKQVNNACLPGGDYSTFPECYVYNGQNFVVNTDPSQTTNLFISPHSRCMVECCDGGSLCN